MGDDSLHATEVDGVPVFWAPGDGMLRASLWFRAGMADETLPTRGWLHLLEHLALHDRDTIRTPVNGHVSLLHTSFDVAGEPDAVAAFLLDICRWLSAPQLTELEHERRVLRAEAAGRGGAVAAHLLWRYGAQGPGLAGYDELGLHTAQPDGLRQLAAATYRRGNAALALVGGPPPAGLRLPLPDGPRQPARSARPCDQPAPAGFVDRPGAVALSGTVRRSVAAAATTRALERALHRELRDRSGVGYSAWASYELVDADHAMVIAGIDVLPEASGSVAATTAAVRRIRDRGLPPGELTDDVEREIRRHREEPWRWQPMLAVRDALLDRPPTLLDEMTAELRALTVEDVQRTAAMLWNDLLVSAGPESAGDPQLSWLDGPPPTGTAPSGRRFRPVGSPVTKGSLTIGQSAARLETAGHRSAVAAYDDLAAVMAFPDGGRRLVRRDGYQIVLEPTLWRAGREAVSMIDAAVPGTLVVPMPQRPPEEIPRTTLTARERISYWIGRPTVIVPLALGGGLGIVLLVARYFPELWGLPAGAVIAAGIVAYLRRSDDDQSGSTAR